MLGGDKNQANPLNSLTTQQVANDISQMAGADPAALAKANPNFGANMLNMPGMKSLFLQDDISSKKNDLIYKVIFHGAYFFSKHLKS